jgi:hypothetical protein
MKKTTENPYDVPSMVIGGFVVVGLPDGRFRIWPKGQTEHQGWLMTSEDIHHVLRGDRVVKEGRDREEE